MGFSKFKHVKMTAIGGVVPENILNIDDEIAFYKNDAKLLSRNKKILGLGTRRVVSEGVGNTDLCEAAARKIIEENKINKDDIEAIIIASTSHDYRYPASACVLHGRLNLPETCSCFDITGVSCSGYVYALWQAYSLIESKAVKNCLVIVGDIGSRHSNIDNRSISILLGDSAVATYLEYDENENESFFLTGSRGKDWKKLIAPASGALLPVKSDIVNLEIVNDNGDVWHMWEDIMKGFDVFKYTAEIGPTGVKDLLNYAEKGIDDIDFFAIHQANKQIVDTVARNLSLPQNKYSTETFTRIGNCGIAAVATNVCDQLVSKEVKDIVFASFGVGLSYSFALIDMSCTNNSGLSIYKTPENVMTREEQIEYWIKYFKGEVDDE